MKNATPDQGPRRPKEVDPPETRPSKPSWSDFQTWLRTRHQLLDLGIKKERLEQLRDDGEISRLERTVELQLKVLAYALVGLLTLTAIGLEIALFVVSPGIFALSVPIVGGGAWKLIKALEGRGGSGGKPEDDP